MLDYGLGYLQAAAVLVQQIDKKNPNLDPQLAVYPIVYCYRHYLELAIKHLLDLTGHVLDQPRVLAKHDVNVLWETVKTRLLQMHMSSEQIALVKSSLGQIDSAIQTFADHDKESMTFRYPYDKKGDFLPSKLSSINLEHLHNSMELVYESINVIYAQIRPYVMARQFEEDALNDVWVEEVADESEVGDCHV